MSTVEDIRALKGKLKNRQRLLGLDPGTKTIGLALSDFTLTIATPMETIKRKKFTKDILRIKEIIAEHDVGGFVIGLPINMDGSEGPRCQSVRQFASNLAQHFDVPMAFWDERLSTAGVERTLLQADVSRAKRAEVIDKMAASYILQGALDAIG